MPMLGIMASAISGNLWAPTGAYDSISSVTLSAATPSITFSGIPSTYTHLQLRCTMLGTSATAAGSVNVQFNGDTGANYAFHLLNGIGSGTPAAYGAASASNGRFFGYTGGIRTIYPTVGIVDILDYASITKYKTMRGLAGNDFNGSGEVQFSSSLWMNSASGISTITITDSSMNFDTNSSFALYGVK